MRKSQVWFSYISGNLPISLVYFISVLFDILSMHTPELLLKVGLLTNTDSISDMALCTESILAIIYLLATLYSTFQTYLYFHEAYTDLEKKINCNQYLLSDTKLKTIFSSGSITYYVLPLASFASSDNNLKGALILTVLFFLFGCIYVRERLTAYTPILVLLGYSMLSGTITTITENKIIIKDTLLLTKVPKHFIYGTTYHVHAKRLTDSVMIGKIE